MNVIRMIISSKTGIIKQKKGKKKEKERKFSKGHNLTVYGPI